MLFKHLHFKFVRKCNIIPEEAGTRWEVVPIHVWMGEMLADADLARWLYPR